MPIVSPRRKKPISGTTCFLWLYPLGGGQWFCQGKKMQQGTRKWAVGCVADTGSLNGWRLQDTSLTEGKEWKTSIIEGDSG